MPGYSLPASAASRLTSALAVATMRRRAPLSGWCSGADPLGLDRVRAAQRGRAAEHDDEVGADGAGRRVHAAWSAGGRTGATVLGAAGVLPRGRLDPCAELRRRSSRCGCPPSAGPATSCRPAAASGAGRFPFARMREDPGHRRGDGRHQPRHRRIHRPQLRHRAPGEAREPEDGAAARRGRAGEDARRGRTTRAAPPSR